MHFFFLSGLLALSVCVNKVFSEENVDSPNEVNQLILDTEGWIDAGGRGRMADGARPRDLDTLTKDFREAYREARGRPGHQTGRNHSSRRNPDPVVDRLLERQVCAIIQIFNRQFTQTLLYIAELF